MTVKSAAFGFASMVWRSSQTKHRAQCGVVPRGAAESTSSNDDRARLGLGQFATELLKRVHRDRGITLVAIDDHHARMIR